MNLTWVLIATYSLIIPSVIGWVRFKRIHPTFYPFLFFIWLGLLNEILSTILIHRIRTSNAVNSNIYVLMEALLLVWQFERWGSFSNRKSAFKVLIGLLSGIWIIENMVISRITNFCSYFMIIYSGILCLLSIRHLNYIVARERGNLLMNAIFLICSTLIIYYSFKVMVEAFSLSDLKVSQVFKSNIYRIHGYVNLLSNCIFALAILWAPQRQRFSLPSS